MEPYDTIELGISRANGVRRQLEILAQLEPDEQKKAAHRDAAATAERYAGDLYSKWNSLLVKNMTNWESRANVSHANLQSASALVKRSITELENNARTIGVVTRSIERIAALVALVARIAAL